MKRNRGLMRWALLLSLCLGGFTTMSPASAAVPANRCKDRCKEEYRRRVDECRNERDRRGGRHLCEERAKREREDCKRHCR